MTPHDVPSARPAGRLLWADAAKGLCIALVVLHHVTGKHYGAVLPDGYAAAEGLWVWVSETLKPVRMPLFFVISGLFAASALRRPWAQVVGPRVVTPYYLYVIWLSLQGVLFTYEQDLPMNRTQDLGELAADLVYASTGVWYLYALAVYFLLLKAFGRGSPPLVVAGAAAVAVAATFLPIEEVNRASVLQNFVYFAAGACLPAAVRRMGELRMPGLVPALLLGFWAVHEAMSWLGAGWLLSNLALSLVAVPLGIRCAVLLAGRPRLGAAAAYLGRRTLPVYVLHMPVLAGLHHLPGLTLPESWGIAGLALAAAYPLLSAAAIIAASLGLHAGLTRLGLGWLFRRPAPARRSTAPVDPVPAARPPG